MVTVPPIHLVELFQCPHGTGQPLILVRMGEEIRSRQGRAVGVLADLIRSYWRGETPIGIVLDRMQEEAERPETEMGELAGFGGEVLAAVVQWLRKRHPDGI